MQIHGKFLVPWFKRLSTKEMKDEHWGGGGGGGREGRPAPPEGKHRKGEGAF